MNFNQDLEIWQKTLKINVDIRVEHFSGIFTSALKEKCKSLIPRAQAFYLIKNNIAKAIPTTYEKKINFDYKGDKYEILFKGTDYTRFNEIQYDHLGKLGTTVIYFNPSISVSQNGYYLCDSNVIIIVKIY
jgi:hypothetical protein